MRCELGPRCSSDLAWLWLWCRLAATALIQHLAQGASLCRRCGPEKPALVRMEYRCPQPSFRETLLGWAPPPPDVPPSPSSQPASCQP